MIESTVFLSFFLSDLSPEKFIWQKKLRVNQGMVGLTAEKNLKLLIFELLCRESEVSILHSLDNINLKV